MDGTEVVVVVAAASFVGFCRFLVEVVYRSARGLCMWFSVELWQPFELVAGILESQLPLVVLSGYGGEQDVLEEDKPVLAVDSSLLLPVVVLLVLPNIKDLGADPGSLRFLDSPIWGSKDPIDASFPFLQYEISCPIINKSDVMQCCI